MTPAHSEVDEMLNLMKEQSLLLRQYLRRNQVEVCDQNRNTLAGKTCSVETFRNLRNSGRIVVANRNVTKDITSSVTFKVSEEGGSSYKAGDVINRADNEPRMELIEKLTGNKWVVLNRSTGKTGEVNEADIERWVAEEKAEKAYPEVATRRHADGTRNIHHLPQNPN